MTNNLSADDMEAIAGRVADLVMEHISLSLPPVADNPLHATQAPPATPEVMDTVQAAKYLKLSTQSLEIKRCKGGGPAFVKWGRAVRYRKAALDDWLLSHEHQNTVGYAA